MAIKGLHIHRVAVWLGAGAVVALALATPVLAQRGGSFDSWFGNFPGYRGGYDRPNERPAPQVDYSRAPSAKKVETAPTSTVLVIGDSMADWLAFGLEEALADTPEIGVLRKHRAHSGLVRYDTRNDALNWAHVARDLLAADKPNYVVIMLGLHDRQAIRERITAAPPPSAATATPAKPGSPAAESKPGEGSEHAKPKTPAAAAPAPPARTRTVVHEFRSEKWIEAYDKRIDDLIGVAKGRGVPVYWVGLPSLRGPKSTADMQFLNEHFRARAEKAGIVYVDVWDGFVDEKGRFSLHGPDFEGQTRRLRTSDGVHFTRAGARKLAHFVEREIRRASARGPVAVALPSSEPLTPPPAVSARPGTAVARPLAGPVVPLTATAGGAGEDLLGGANARTNIGHVTATRVLVKGEAVAAPAGRSDDFSWPRRSVAPFGKDPVVATTTLPLPVMHAPPAATAVLAPTIETPRTRVVQRRPRPQQQQQQREQRWRPFSGWGGGGWAGGGGGLFGGWR